MYFKTLPDHSLPGFDERLHFSRFGKANMIFNARSSGARCDNHVGCLSIKTVLEGEEWYGFGGRTMAVRPGNFLILNDLQEYSCRIVGGSVRTLSVFFKRELASAVHRDMRESEERLLDEPFDSGRQPELVQTLRYVEAELQTLLSTLVASLEREGYQANRVDEQVIPLLNYLMGIHRGDVTASKKVRAVRSSTRKEIYKRVCVAKDMLMSHYRDRIDLDRVGTTSCLSVPQLVRQFKAVFGTTPHHYLSSIRLQRASELLRTTDKSVSDVAWSCGFENVSAFCRAFKQTYGIKGLDVRRQREL